MKNVVRGSTVHIAVTFKDKDEAIVTPTGANLTLSYVPLGSNCERTFVTYPMAQTPGGLDWFYDWDSSVSEPVEVAGHAVTTTPSAPISSVDLSFRLTANKANKELFGDDWRSSPYA